MHTAHLFKIVSTQTGETIAFDICSNENPAAHGPYRYVKPEQPYSVAHGTTLTAAEHAIIRSVLEDLSSEHRSWSQAEAAMLLDMIEARRRGIMGSPQPAKVVTPRRSLDPLAPVLLLADTRALLRRLQAERIEDVADCDPGLLSRMDAVLWEWPTPKARCEGDRRSLRHYYDAPVLNLVDGLPPEAWAVHAVVAVGPLGVGLLHADDNTLALLEHEQWPLETPVAAGVWEFVGRGWGEDDELEVVGKWTYVCGLGDAVKRRS